MARRLTASLGLRSWSRLAAPARVAVAVARQQLRSMPGEGSRAPPSLESRRFGPLSRPAWACSALTRGGHGAGGAGRLAGALSAGFGAHLAYSFLVAEPAAQPAAAPEPEFTIDEVRFHSARWPAIRARAPRRRHVQIALHKTKETRIWCVRLGLGDAGRLCLFAQSCWHVRHAQGHVQGRSLRRH
jgi:hypothetical protein